VEIVWPSGARDLRTDVDADQTLLVEEGKPAAKR
jgi:hypothetical protein